MNNFKKLLNEVRKKGTGSRFTPSQKHKISRPRAIKMELKGFQMLSIEIRKKLTFIGKDEIQGLYTGDWVYVNQYVIPPVITDEELLQMIKILDKNKIDYEYIRRPR